MQTGLLLEMMAGGAPDRAAFGPGRAAISFAEALRRAGWVKARLRWTGTPEVWAFRSALPYNETGKLLRREMDAAGPRAAPA
jgi:acyl-coenzyme A synthetase/AMP-(fatty) acid ligase